MTKRITIYDIKRDVESCDPGNIHFFDRRTMKFFGQTLKMFRVLKRDDGKYWLFAPIYHHGEMVKGVLTQRLYNPETHKLEMVPSEQVD